MKNKHGVAAPLVVIILIIAAFWYFSSHQTNTASVVSSNKLQESLTPLTLSNIQVGTPTAATGVVVGNISFISDTADKKHYTIRLNNATNAGSGSINGTITVQRTGDLSKSAAMNCQFSSGTFRNQVNVAGDSNTYYMAAIGSAKSKVTGFPGQQTAYLKNGAIATTSDSLEQVPVVFTGGNAATPTVQQTIGYYFTLPTGTQLCYLNDGNSIDNTITCDTNGDGTYETTVARLTVTKNSC
ncbi:MAG: hypothetical protein WC979_07560 [Candidatus Pacearchaeota archaeon]